MVPCVDSLGRAASGLFAIQFGCFAAEESVVGSARIWKVLAFAVAGIIVLVATVVGLWQKSSTKLDDRPSLTGQPAGPVAGAPGVYYLGSAPGAVYLIDTAQGLVFVDSGLDANATKVMEITREYDLDIRRLQTILLTHVHADHSLGAAKLRAVTGAKIFAGRADCQQLRSGGPREAFLSTFEMPHIVAHKTTIDVELAGDEVFDFGDARIRVIATPGHTPGSVCYLLEKGQKQILFTGDVIQSANPDAADALGTYSAYLPPRYRGNARDFLATLRKLRALPSPDVVLTGHPGHGTDPPDPHISLVQWHRLLDEGINAMEQLQRRFVDDGADFIDGNPKELLRDLHYLGDHQNWPVYCLFAGSRTILFDAPGGPGLAEFISRRFRELGKSGKKVDVVLLTSANTQALAGLSDIVVHMGAQVFVAKSGIPVVRSFCPQEALITAAAEFPTKGWCEIEAIPLKGRGLSPTAYFLRLAGKTVLISGLIPVKLNAESSSLLVREVSGDEQRQAYLESIDRLEKLTVNLWLPATVVHGQNANLYDQDWSRVLQLNRQLIRP